jgi:hypothetical protein
VHNLAGGTVRAGSRVGASPADGKGAELASPEESFDAYFARVLRRAPLLLGGAVAFFALRVAGIRPGPILVLVASAMALPLSIVRPEVGLYALIVNFVNELDSYYKFQTVVPVSLPILFDAAVAFGIFRRLGRSGAIPSLAQPANVLVVAYVIWVSLSFVLADVWPPNPWGKFRTGFLIRPVIYFFLILLVRSPRDLFRLLAVLVFAEALLMAGTLPDYLRKGGGLYRVRGTLGAINYLSYVCIVTIPILVSLVAYLRDRIARAAILTLAALMLLISLETLSRSGYYALIATLAFLGWRFARKPQFLLVAGAFALMFVQLVPAGLAERLAQTSDITQTSRWLLSRVGLRMALDNALVGVGWANYEAKFLEYDLEHVFSSPKSPHSMYFDIAASNGFPALALYLGAFGWTFRQLSRVESSYRKAGSSRALGALLALGLQGALVGHFVFGLAGSYGNTYYAYMLLGISVALVRLHSPGARFAPVLP